MLPLTRLGHTIVGRIRQRPSMSYTLVSSAQCKNIVMSPYSSHRHQHHQTGNSSKKANHISNTEDVESPSRQRELRYVTIPNALTTSRILLTPAIGYHIWHEMHSYALLYFTVAALTDLLDGFIARRFNQGSKLGAILDPIADKFLLTTCFVALNHANLMPLWLVGGFIGRDLGLMLGGALLRYRGFAQRPPSVRQFCDFNKYPASDDFEPTLMSKCNTALQCLLIVTHLMTYHQTGVPAYDLSISALHALTASTTLVSMGQYAIRASKSSSHRLAEAKKSS